MCIYDKGHSVGGRYFLDTLIGTKRIPENRY